MRTRLHVALIGTTSLQRKTSRQEFQDLDLSDGQPKILAYLISDEGCLQKDLAKRCHVEPATMTALLRKMEQKGLISKNIVYVSGGKRAFGISLTDTGREKAYQSLKVVDKIEEISYRGFTEEEKDTLIALLLRVSNNLSS